MVAVSVTGSLYCWVVGDTVTEDVVKTCVTVTIAVLLVAPRPLSVALILPVVLFFAPRLVPVTLTLMAHWPDAASTPPVRLIELLPAMALRLPPQLELALGGLDSTRPAGRLSVKETPLSPIVVFGFMMANPSPVEPPN
jgi:hypothetical protein